MHVFGDQVAGISTAPLANLAFGAQVLGLTSEALHDEAARAFLRDIWIDRGLIVFRDFVGLDNQLELSRCFGDLVRHPVAEARASREEITAFRFSPDDGWLLEVDGVALGIWLPWHTDLIYSAEINHGGILRPIEIPEALGETGFLDKIAAYDSLPADLRERVDGLEVIYKFDVDPANQRFGRLSDVRTIRFSAMVGAIQTRMHEFPLVTHPMVYAQAETGRKILNVSPWFADGILGLEKDDGDALLEEVIAHCLAKEHTYHHRWEVTDMVLWDNWRMLHCSAGCRAHDRRWMERTTILGDYGLGRVLGKTEKRAADYVSV